MLKKLFFGARDYTLSSPTLNMMIWLTTPSCVMEPYYLMLLPNIECTINMHVTNPTKDNHNQGAWCGESLMDYSHLKFKNQTGDEKIVVYFDNSMPKHMN